MKDTIMKNSVKSLSEEASTLAHEATLGAEHAIRSTQRVARQGLDRMAEGLEDARVQTSSVLKHLGRDANSLTHRGMDAVRDGSHQLREKSMHMRDATTTYIRHEPGKSILIAAAVGAALVGLVALFSRYGNSDR